MKNSKLKIFLVGFCIGISALSQLGCHSGKNSNENNFTKTIPVTVCQAKREALQQKLSITGVINADKDVAIVSEAQGKVVSVSVKIGDRVGVNSVIAKLDDELLKANFISAEASYIKLKKDLEIYEKLLKENSASTTQYETIKMQYKNAEANFLVAKRRLGDAVIKSPISGIITAKNVEIGQMVNPGFVAANVVDISRLKVKINISEKNAFRVKKGEDVKVTTDIYPGIEFKGRIESISDKCDKVHNYPVEITLENSKEHPLKAGMFGKVSFKSINNDSVILIPREAIVLSVKNPQIFVINNGVAKLRDVVVGDDYDAKITILSGLEVGEEVAVSGINNLKDGYKVDIKASSK